MDQTCVDTDDDNLEFEDAQIEEEEDNILHDVSAFMVSKANISRYAQDRTAKHVKGKPIIPNKILDSEYLRDTVDYSMKMDDKKLKRALESLNTIKEIANSN